MPRSNKSGVSHAIRIPIRDVNVPQEQVTVTPDSESRVVGEPGPELTGIPAGTEVTPSPGNSSSTSSTKRASTPKRNEKNPPHAPTTESH